MLPKFLLSEDGFLVYHTVHPKGLYIIKDWFQLFEPVDRTSKDEAVNLSSLASEFYFNRAINIDKREIYLTDETKQNRYLLIKTGIKYSLWNITGQKLTIEDGYNNTEEQLRAIQETILERLKI